METPSPKKPLENLFKMPKAQRQKILDQIALETTKPGKRLTSQEVTDAEIRNP